MSHVAIDVRCQTSTAVRAGTFGALSGSDLGSADFMTCTDALALHKELREVFRSAIGNSPFPVLDLEGGSLLFAFFAAFGRRLLSGWLFVTAFFTTGLLLSERWLFWLFKHFILNFILVDILFFSFILEADDALDLADVFLDHEKLVHETKFEAVIGPNKAVGIAHTLKQDGGLIGTTVLLNGGSNEINH